VFSAKPRNSSLLTAFFFLLFLLPRWWASLRVVTKLTNYMKLSKKITAGADNLANLSPYNPLVYEITKDFKPTNIKLLKKQVYNKVAEANSFEHTHLI
jgi:hypothetical protein